MSLSRYQNSMSKELFITQYTDYEYRGAMAQFWDLLRGDTSNWPDKFFYQNIIAESGQP